ncbi:MAG: hypothetical protein PHS54_00385 [Clostridia bacterium]|nr:hypothetical protein [Clostridia bacterium]
MNLNHYTNENFSIVLKTDEDIHWCTNIDCINTPSTIVFAVSANPQIIIKKIVWDFGNGNQCKSFTNRKQELNCYGISCKYKKSHDSTIVIQASVYTDDNMFTPLPITTTTVNQNIKEHYVEPEEFKNQILEYYKTNVFSNEVAESIYKIANHLAFAGNFINYTYREEMVGDAIIRMIEALTSQKFDPLKGNPFSYFTKIAFHAFCNRIKKEKKIRQTIINYQNEVYGGLRSEGILPYNRSDNMHNMDDSYDQDTYHEDI